MLEQTSCVEENASRHLQLDASQAAPHEVVSCRSMQFLWTGFGFALCMLIGVSARAVLPAASHASPNPPFLSPNGDFNPANGRAVAFAPSVLLPRTAAKPSVTVSARQQGIRAQQRGQGLTTRMGIGDFFSGIGQALDDFADDAMDRKLGNGAAFYGKRKSEFYGKDDDMRKVNPRIARADEDYAGPRNTGYFQLIKDDEGNMVPVTKMKGREVGKVITQEQTNSDEFREDFKAAAKADGLRQRLQQAFDGSEKA